MRAALFVMIFSLFAFSPYCGASVELESAVIELSVDLGDRKVIDGAVLEAFDGREARLTVYETEDLDTGVVVSLSVLSEAADLFGAEDAPSATFMDVSVSMIGGDKPGEIAKATVGVMPEKLASVKLGGGEAVTISLRIIGSKSYSLDDGKIGKIAQCRDGVISLGDQAQAKSSCCSRRCKNGGYEYMECCNAVCCVCGVCCAAP